MPKHGKRFRVFMNDKHFSAKLREFNVTRPIDTADSSAFGSTYKEVVVGLADGGISMSGFFDGTALSIDQEMNAAMGTGVQTRLLGAPQGVAAVGDIVFAAQCVESTYDIAGSIGDLVTVSANFQSDEIGVRTAKSLKAGATNGDPASVSATGNSTNVIETALTSGGYAAYLSVTDNTRSATVVVKVEHSTDGSSWADLCTFATVGIGAETSERKTGTGTVNRYLRGNWTVNAGTGAITFVLCLARL